MHGFSPTLTWQKNLDGERRSEEQALEIATKHGVKIPDDVEFFVDPLGELGEHIFARGPKITEPAGGIVLWESLLNIHQKVPFIVREDVFDSDEAIVAVYAHEIHELECLRPLLQKGKVTIEDFGAYTDARNPGNFHDEAWDIADELVEKMREQ